jgi:hypothetical protein
MTKRSLNRDLHDTANSDHWVYAALCSWASRNGDVQVIKIGSNIQLYRISTNDKKPFAVVEVKV